MKTCIFIIFASFILCHDCSAQWVGEIPIEDIDSEYIRINGSNSGQTTINIDFGQLEIAFRQKHSQVRDDSGNPIKFNSIIDAINFMHKYGYEVEHIYSVGSDGNSVPNFIMRKKDVK